MFGDRLKELRKSRHLNQNDLSKMTQRAVSSVSAWEHNEYVPSIDLIELLARGLNTSVSYLLGYTDDPLPSPLDRVRQDLTEQTFANLAILAGFVETMDEDANVTLSNGTIAVNETPELIAQVMGQLLEYLVFILSRQ